MSRLSELQKQQEKASAEIAEIAEGVSRFEKWCQSAPQKKYDLQKQLFTLLVDTATTDMISSPKINNIRGELDMIDLRLEQKDAILHELKERIYSKKISTGIDQLGTEILFIRASKAYPVIRDEIIASGRLDRGQREKLITLGKQARKGSEARRLVDEIKQREERNDLRRPFVFTCDQN